MDWKRCEAPDIVCPPPIEVLWIYLAGLVFFLVYFCIVTRFQINIPWFIKEKEKWRNGRAYTDAQTFKAYKVGDYFALDPEGMEYDDFDVRKGRASASDIIKYPKEG
jgi:hypothetical protein